VSLRIGISPWADTRVGMERVAEAAASGGLGTFWLGDGLLGRPDFPIWSGGMESVAELAWLAGRFPGSAIGLGAAVLPLRDPLWLAKQGATLDHLTGGRFTLVLAPGNWPDEFAAEGRDFTTRGTALEAGIRTLQQVWAVDAPDPGPSPRPLTPGGPPLWLAGARATMGRAIRLGLPFQAARIGPTRLAPTAAEWFDGGGTVLAVRVRFGLGAGATEGDEDGTGSIIGPPEFLADRVDAYRRLGVTDLSVMPGQDTETSLRTIEALIERVVPALDP